ncbi:hypothetical protein V4T56_004257 [Vibrio vulnificus]|nr:hypothetical protein [Vibrio vulnificus]EIZ1354447.1 hypothetical protein [Vibrio vulnificus]EJE8540551.1 hypothetical protein [Vibrio vulnificus]EKA7343428.1 hypothetical protein [Vibrio vulnificus]EKD9327856.1 hypothetical protein [Vibrio vulnificus]
MDFVNIGLTVGASAISGLAGVFIHKHISRAKPTINVTSLSFSGDVVEVSDEIQSLSRKCTWTDTVKRYLAYEELSDFEVEASQVSAALKQTKENVDQWLEVINTDGSNSQFSRNLLLRSPLIVDRNVILSHLNGLIRRHQFVDLPTSIEELKEMDNILPIETSSTKYTVHCVDFFLPFSKKDLSEGTAENVELLAYSIAKGDMANIIKLHELFSNNSGSQVYNYDKLLVEVKKHLVQNSKLSLTVSMSNSGDSPIIIKPYFSVKLLFGEQSKVLVLENLKKRNSKVDFPFVDIVRSEKYQNTSASTNYVSLRAGGSLEVELVSSDTLGRASNEISDFYELGGLQGQVFAQSETGKVIKSKKTVFSKVISDSDRKDLIDIAT